MGCLGVIKPRGGLASQAEAQMKPRRPKWTQESQMEARRPKCSPGDINEAQESKMKPRRPKWSSGDPRGAQEAQMKSRRPRWSPGCPNEVRLARGRRAADRQASLKKIVQNMSFVE